MDRLSVLSGGITGPRKGTRREGGAPPQEERRGVHHRRARRLQALSSRSSNSKACNRPQEARSPREAAKIAHGCTVEGGRKSQPGAFSPGGKLWEGGARRPGGVT